MKKLIMKKLIHLLIALCFISSAWASVSFVSGSSVSNGSNYTVQLPSMSQTAGDYVIIIASWCANSSCNASTSSDTVTISDTAGNTTYYSTALLRFNASTCCAIAIYCGAVNTTASNQITWTNSPTSTQYLDVDAFEVSGAAPCASILDSAVTNTNYTASMTTASSPLVLAGAGGTSANNELAYSVCNWRPSAYPSGWTGIQNSYNYDAYEAITTSGTTPSASWPFTSTQTLAATAIIALKPPTGGSTVRHRAMVIQQ